MPPKIKSILAPEPMAATQPDSPEMPDTQTESDRDLSIVAHGGEVIIRSTTPIASRWEAL